jgi:hypothetical protein
MTAGPVDRIVVTDTAELLTLELFAGDRRVLTLRQHADLSDDAISATGVTVPYPVDSWTLGPTEMWLEHDRRSADLLGVPGRHRLALTLPDADLVTLRAAVEDILQCYCSRVDL